MMFFTSWWREKDKWNREKRGHCPDCYSEVYKRARRRALNGLNQPMGGKPGQSYELFYRAQVIRRGHGRGSLWEEFLGDS